MHQYSGPLSKAKAMQPPFFETWESKGYLCKIGCTVYIYPHINYKCNKLQSVFWFHSRVIG